MRITIYRVDDEEQGGYALFETLYEAQAYRQDYLRQLNAIGVETNDNDFKLEALVFDIKIPKASRLSLKIARAIVQIAPKLDPGGDLLEL